MDRNIFRKSDGELSVTRIVTGTATALVSVITLVSAVLQIPGASGAIAKYILPGNDSVNLIAVHQRSNDFVASGEVNLGGSLQKSKDEVWLFGSSFFLTVPTFKDLIIDRLQNGVKFTFVILDPFSEDFGPTAKSMGYDEERLSHLIKEGLSALLLLDAERKRKEIHSQFDVWLTKQPFTARLYMFDPQSEGGRTYLVPQVYGRDSIELPGFLLSNSSSKYHLKYLDGIRKLANKDFSTMLNEWVKQHPKYISYPQQGE